MTSHPSEPSRPEGSTDRPGDEDVRGTESPAPPAYTPPQPSGSNSFFDWFRSLGTPRGQDRWVGGVASGIAHRVGLDPILVRGIFVLLFIFGGIGVLLYGLAWALLPETDGRIHAEEAGRGRWTSGMTGALIITVLGLFAWPFGFFSEGWDFGGFLWAVIWLGAIVYFIYWLATRNRSTPPPAYGPYGPAPQGFAAPGAPGAPVPPAYGASAGSAYAPPGVGVTGREQDPTVPLGPLGMPHTAAGDPSAMGSRPATEQQWPGYTPRPVRPPVPPKPRRRGPSGADIALTLGAALLAGGILLALNQLGYLTLAGAWLPVATAAALLCIGLGIVVLGIRGRTSGVLGFLAAVGVVLSLIFTAGVQWQTANYAVGTTTTWTPESGASASEGYSIVASNGTLDLTAVTASTFGGPVVVPVNAAAASVTVIVPENVPVEVKAAMAMGNVEYEADGQSRQTAGMWQPRSFIINDDGAGPDIILQIKGAASDVNIVEAQGREGSQ